MPEWDEEMERDLRLIADPTSPFPEWNRRVSAAALAEIDRQAQRIKELEAALESLAAAAEARRAIQRIVDPEETEA